jgi:hypothetical protein
MHLRAANRTSGRAGTVIVELIMVLPIFVVLLTAMIEFGLILNARQHLLTASREAARVASHGAPVEEIVAAAKTALGDGTLSAADVTITRFEEDHFLPNAPRDRVQVVLHIPTTRVVPDFLGLIGISFAEDELAAGTVMSMETLMPPRRLHEIDGGPDREEGK